MTPIYHLEIEAKNCQVAGILNGFPIYSLDGTNAAVFSKPINAGLTGNGNTLKLLIKKSGPLDSKKPYGIKGKIKKYKLGDITAPELGEVVNTFNVENSPASTVRFDNDVLDFSSRLLKAPKIENEEPVIQYALQLQKFLVARQTEMLIIEFTPKLSDYATCYGMELPDLTSQFRNFLTDVFYQNNPLLSFKKSDLKITEWCDGRMVEISILPELRPFMMTTVNDKGKEFSTKLFVGLHSGKLKVVR